MKTLTLELLLEQSLQELYDVEEQIAKALPKMIKNAESEELVNALTSHLKETEEQLTRVEKMCDLAQVKAKAMKAPGIRGIIDEGEMKLKETYDSPELADLVIASAARHVEHYEMAKYMVVRELAANLGHDPIVELIDATLSEEENADDSMADIAETNLAALRG